MTQNRKLNYIQIFKKKTYIIIKRSEALREKWRTVYLCYIISRPFVNL